MQYVKLQPGCLLVVLLFPTILLLGIYIDFENPSIRKITLHKDEMIDGFATMVESRDNNNGGHIKRTRAYVDLILKKMRHDRKYHEILNKDYATNVRNAAPLHDMGKISELWLLPMCLMRFPKRDAIGMQCRWKSALPLLRRESELTLIRGLRDFFLKPERK